MVEGVAEEQGGAGSWAEAGFLPRPCGDSPSLLRAVPTQTPFANAAMRWFYDWPLDSTLGTWRSPRERGVAQRDPVSEVGCPWGIQGGQEGGPRGSELGWG